MALPGGLDRRIKALQATRPWRAWQRYGNTRGAVLAGGMAYDAFFSLLPALAVGFTVFGLVVGNNDDLKARVVKAVNDGIGTVVITPPGGTGGIVSLETLTGGDQLTITAIIGLVGFLLTGLGWLAAMREGIRAMFGQPTFTGNVVITKLRDLGVLVTFGVVILASAVLAVVVNTSAGWLLDLVGLRSSTIGNLVVGALGTLVVLAVDVAVFLVLFGLLSGVDLPRHDLWDAALFGGIGLGVLKLLSGLLLKSAGNNKLLAVAVGVLALLVWLNLVSRLTLVAAAWGATVAIDRGHLVINGYGLPGATRLPSEIPAADPPAAGGSVPRPAPATAGAVAVPVTATAARPVRVPGGPASVPFAPVVSPRAADRVSVAAGAVLGAAGVVAARTAANAVRTVLESVRRSD